MLINVVYLYSDNNKQINIMTTLQSQTTHKLVAKTLRYSGYKATCVRNENFDFNNYEVIVKGIDSNEAKELQQRFFSMLKNSMINIINN